VRGWLARLPSEPASAGQTRARTELIRLPGQVTHRLELQARKKASCLERMARDRAAETPGNDPTGGLSCRLLLSNPLCGLPPHSDVGSFGRSCGGLMRALAWCPIDGVSRRTAGLADLAQVPWCLEVRAVLLRGGGKRGRATVISLERKPRFLLGWWLDS
jgi:hypothetical protein